MFLRFEALERPSRATLRHQIGPSYAANDFHGWTMCSWLWKFNSDGFCPFEKANPAAGSRIMPRWDMNYLGEKYRVSSWEIHINETVTNTKSGCCEKYNSTDQCPGVGLDTNTQATKNCSANASTDIRIVKDKYKYRHKYKYRRKYKYAVTMATARSFRKLNSDGFCLLRNANRTSRYEVMTVWIFSTGVPVSGWRLLSRWRIEKNLNFWQNSNL